MSNYTFLLENENRRLRKSVKKEVEDNHNQLFDRIDFLNDKIIEAIGWMHAEACVAVDKGEDIRNISIPDLIDRAKRDLEL